MGRLIDADKLKEKLLESPDNIVDVSLIIDLIDDEPIVNEWIPCNKRLPNTEDGEEDYIWAITKDGECTAGYIEFNEEDESYECSTDCEIDLTLYNVVAWMPIIPYKGE